MLTRDPFEAALLAEQSAAKSAEEDYEGRRENKRKREAENENENEENEEAEDYVCGAGKGSGGDPDGLAKIQEIISQFTDEQMNRYEMFRRSGFKKAKITKLLSGILGTQKISDHMSITVSALAKMFVGDLTETARVIMMEKKERGPIRPCHIREAFRRLKLRAKFRKETRFLNFSVK